MGKQRLQCVETNDHIKIRLQLFYLDELVQMASESLCRLESTEVMQPYNVLVAEQECDQGTKGARSKSLSPENRTPDEGKLNTIQSAQYTIFTALAANDNFTNDWAAQNGDSPITWELQPFDFGRDPMTLKQQRLFFRDRLPSNQFSGGAHESLMQMRKQGSFLFREFEVPSPSEIERAKSVEKQNLQQADQSNSPTQQEETKANQTSLSKLDRYIMKLAAGSSNESSTAAGGVSSSHQYLLIKQNSKGSWKDPKKKERGASLLAERCSRGSQGNINFSNSAGRNSLPFNISRRISQDQYNIQADSAGCVSQEGFDERLQSDDGAASHFTFAPTRIAQKQPNLKNNGGQLTDTQQAPNNNSLSQGSGGYSGAPNGANITTTSQLGNISNANFDASMNSAKSESGSSLANGFDDDFEREDDENLENDNKSSLGSLINMQTLNLRTLSRVNIADRKLSRKNGDPIFGRKMSCQDDFFKQNQNYRLIRFQEDQYVVSSFHQSRRVSAKVQTRPSNQVQLMKIGSCRAILKNSNSSAAAPASGSDQSNILQSTSGGGSDGILGSDQSDQMPVPQRINSNQSKNVRKHRNSSKKKRSRIQLKNVLENNRRIASINELTATQRENIKKKLLNPINQEDEEHNMRKDCLRYLRALGKCLRGPLPASKNSKYAQYERELETIQQETTSGEYQCPEDDVYPSKKEQHSEINKGAASKVEVDDEYMNAFKKSTFDFQQVSQQSAQSQTVKNNSVTIKSNSLKTKPNHALQPQMSQNTNSLIKCQRCSPIQEEDETIEELRISLFETANNVALPRKRADQQVKTCQSISDSSSSINRDNSNSGKNKVQGLIRAQTGVTSEYYSPYKNQNNNFRSSLLLPKGYGDSKNNDYMRRGSVQTSLPSASRPLSVTKKSTKLRVLKESLQELDRSLEQDTTHQSSGLYGLSPRRLTSQDTSFLSLASQGKVSGNTFQSRKSIEKEVEQDLDGFQHQMSKLFQKNTSFNGSFTSLDKKKRTDKSPIELPFYKQQSQLMSGQGINLLDCQPAQKRPLNQIQKQVSQIMQRQRESIGSTDTANVNNGINKSNGAVSPFKRSGLPNYSFGKSGNQ